MRVHHNGQPGPNLVLLAALLAIVIADEPGADDIGLLGDLFSAVSENLAILSRSKGKGRPITAITPSALRKNRGEIVDSEKENPQRLVNQGIADFLV